jgi:hypothetical protein
MACESRALERATSGHGSHFANPPQIWGFAERRLARASGATGTAVARSAAASGAK